MSKGIVEQAAEVFKPQAPLWACELTSKHVIVGGANRSRRQVAAQLKSELPGGALSVSQSETNIQNPEVARSAIKELLTTAGFRGSEIAVVVPDDTSRIAFLTAENAVKKTGDLQTFIRWKLKKTVPFDVDSAQVAFQILGRHNAGQGVDMLVALSPRSIVEEYENLFDSLDIHAGMVLPSTLAALNLFEPPAGDTLYLKVSPDSITTSVFQNKRIQFYRRVADVSLYDAVFPTIMYYQDKLGGQALENFFVCGYEADLRTSLQEVQEKTGLSPQRMEPRNIDDVYKPVFGSVHLSWRSLI